MINSTYLIIPYMVYTDKRLHNFDKLLYGKIYSLSRQTDYCWASNSYIAKELNVSSSYVSKSINKLRKYNYIICELDNNSKNDVRRKIFINKKEIY